MRKHGVQFEFLGFDPEYEMKKVISSMAEKLYLNSPSDSAMKVALKKGKDVIQASCRIVSQAGTFVAETVSDTPVKAIHKIEEKINQQLDEWKRIRRFESLGGE